MKPATPSATRQLQGCRPLLADSRLGTEWCPECNGYGSSLFEETERCTRCGGSGLVMVAEPAEEPANGHGPARRSQQH